MWNRDKWLPTIYFVIGQAGWFACVLSAARGAPWIGALFAALLVALHLSLALHPIEELKLLACVLPVSALWETMLVRTRLLEYPSGNLVSGVAPYWILALWALFTAQFNTTYRWLKPHLLIAALLGAVAGPLSFRGGAALGAVRFVQLWPAVAALAVGWGLLLPLLTVLSKRYDGVRPRNPK